MKYQEPKFSSRPASKEYRDNFAKVFRPAKKPKKVRRG